MYSHTGKCKRLQMHVMVQAAVLFRAYDLTGCGWLSQDRMASALSELALVVHHLHEDDFKEVRVHAYRCLCA